MLIGECDKAETSGTAGVFVHHQSGINHWTELGKEPLKLFLGSILTDAAHENLGCPFLFLSRDGSLGINLDAVVSPDLFQA